MCRTKQFLSALLALALLLCALPMGMSAIADSDGTFDDFTYRVLEDGTVEITGYSGTTTTLAIPAEIDGKPVTSIGSSAFGHCTSLTGITIPGSVTKIGDSAFGWCTSLTDIFVSKDNNNYTDIDGVLFAKDKTTLIQYPVGKTATNYTISDSVTSIGKWAFAYCTSLTGITIPGSVTTIGDDAFAYCTSLTGITIPDSVTEIGSNAFRDCTSLTSVTIPGSVTSIEGFAFYRCSSLTSVTIPDSVASIGYNAFDGCTSLTSVTIPGSVTSIGESAFGHCTSLTSITIPNSVTNIGKGAFGWCTSLTDIFVSKDSNNYTDIDGVLFTKDKTTLIQYPAGKAATNYAIPGSVTKIGGYAFSGCTSLTSVTIPGSVTSIEGWAFSGCTSLTSVAIPGSVTSIEGWAFQGCKSLTGVAIPGSVTSIGDGAFKGCTSLTSVTIPDSVTKIGSEAFNGCTSLTGITIPNSVTKIGFEAFRGCTSLTSITIPDSVTEIGSGAFGDCTSLTIYGKEGSYAQQYAKDNNIPFVVGSAPAILVSDTVTIQGVDGTTFGDGTTLVVKNVANDNALKLLGEGYATCIVLDITLQQNGQEIQPDGAVKVTLDVPEGYDGESCRVFRMEVDGSLTDMNATLIGNGTKLTFTTPHFSQYVIAQTKQTPDTPDNDFTYRVLEDGTVEITDYSGTATTLAIPAEIDGKPVTSIGAWAFRDCTSLTGITIPDSITEIGDFAFEDCTSLTSITIPDSVTSIGWFAFYGCTSLTSVTIPGSVAAIGKRAFHNCTSLTGILVSEDNANYTDIDGVLFTKGEATLIQYPVGKTATNYTIPGSVTEIGQFAFSDCTSLTSITIPDSVTSIGDCAFSPCTSLTDIFVSDSNTNYTDIDGVLFTKDKTTLIQYPAGKSAINYTIPSGVTSIGGSAFEDCTSLTGITIPDSVTSIGDCAFEGCTSLTGITIPDSVTSIGNDAFEDCTSLTGITIPDSVTEIGQLAFEGCTSLIDITIPGSVARIGYSAFYSCTSLTDIFVSDSNANYMDIDGVLFTKSKHTLIQYPAGKATTNYTIPDSVTSIEENAFSGCTSLTSVTIPDSVTVIEWYAFSGCTSLTSITIPDSVTRIEGYVFEGCEFLTIYGKEESHAHQYAQKHHIPFVAGSAPVTDLASDTVTIQGVDGTAFDNGTTLVVKNAANDNALKLLGEDYETCTVLDITLQQNGQEIQPGGAVKVILNVPEGYNAESCRVFRMEADGSLTDMNATLLGNGAKLTFTTTHFSQYVIAQSKQPPVTLGDVNGDGEVDTADAVLVLQRAAELIGDDDLNRKAADVNGDGAIDTADAVLILQKAAELIERFPTK